MFMHNYIKVAMLLSINQCLITSFGMSGFSVERRQKEKESFKKKSNSNSSQSNRPKKQQTNKQIDVQPCVPTKQQSQTCNTSASGSAINAVLRCVCSCHKIGHHNSCNGAANIHTWINFQKMTILSLMCLSFLHQIWSNKSLDFSEQFISETMPTCGLYLQLMFGTT
jgi:hypothetical protein